MPLPYSEKVLEHFMHPRNIGRIEDPDAVATMGNPACGDMIKIYLKVDGQEKRITDIKFESYGCASNIATGSIVTELAKGKTLEEAKRIGWKEADQELGGLPPVKVHCAVLAVDALHMAIENYEHQHGLLKEKVPTDEKVVLKRLKHVINPKTGREILQANLVRAIAVDGGRVRVELDLPPDYQFASALEEEIRERLEPLWDVREVEVAFVGEE
jgi:NifU-like protein involved in Fe-S cluster formation/metal-sulfur cluster biosynthetic enzyme